LNDNQRQFIAPLGARRIERRSSVGETGSLSRTSRASADPHRHACSPSVARVTQSGCHAIALDEPRASRATLDRRLLCYGQAGASPDRGSLLTNVQGGCLARGRARSRSWQEASMAGALAVAFGPVAKAGGAVALQALAIAVFAQFDSLSVLSWPVVGWWLAGQRGLACRVVARGRWRVGGSSRLVRGRAGVRRFRGLSVAPVASRASRS